MSQLSSKSLTSLQSLGIFLLLAGFFAGLSPALEELGLATFVLGLFLCLAYWGAKRGWRYFPIAPIVVGILISGYLATKITENPSFSGYQKQRLK